MKIKITTGKTCIEYEEPTNPSDWPDIIGPSEGIGKDQLGRKRHEVFMDNVKQLCLAATKMEQERQLEELI